MTESVTSDPRSAGSAYGPASCIQYPASRLKTLRHGEVRYGRLQIHVVNMWQIETRFSVHLGGNTYINTPNLVVYKGEPIFRVRRNDDGMLGIDFDVFDKSGRRVAKIVESIVVFGDVANYAVETGYEKYAVTDVLSGRTIARVQRRGEGGAELDVWVSTYLPNGLPFDAGPTTTNIGGSGISGITVADSPVGISIG